MHWLFNLGLKRLGGAGGWFFRAGEWIKQKGGGNAVFWSDERLVPAALCFPLSPCLNTGQNMLFLQELFGLGHLCPGISVSGEAIPHSAQTYRPEQRLEPALAEHL